MRGRGGKLLVLAASLAAFAASAQTSARPASRPAPGVIQPVQRPGPVIVRPAPRAETLLPAERALAIAFRPDRSPAETWPGLTARTLVSAHVPGSPAPYRFACTNLPTTNDYAQLNQSPTHHVVRFQCGSASVDGGAVSPAKLYLAFRRGADGAFAPGRGPRVLKRGDGPLAPPASRAADEVARCDAAWKRYKAGAGVFVVDLIGGYPRCSSVVPSQYAFSPAALHAFDPAVLKLLPAPEPVAAGRYSVVKDPNGTTITTLLDPYWFQDTSQHRIGFVTSGRPPYGLVRLQRIKGAANPPKTCTGWNDPALVADVGTYAITSYKTGPALAAELGLGHVPEPWMSYLEIPTQDMEALKAAVAPNDVFVRVVPFTRDVKGPICAGPPTGRVRVNFGQTPSQKASAEVTAQIQAYAALHKAASEEAAAIAAKAAGAPLITAEIVGWTPPYRYASAGPLMTTPVNGKTSFTVDEAISPDVVWPDEHRKNWGAECVLDPYYFQQAAEHAAKPNSWWDWILLTINAWSAIYTYLQDFVVEGFAYLSTAGECPFNPDFDPDKANANPGPGACAAYKKGLSTALKYAMTAAGAPSSLPSTNDLSGMAADYLVATAISQAGGDAAAEALTDEQRQELTGKLSDRLRKQAYASSCAQPLKPGEDPKAHGYDGVNPQTLCGYKAKSPSNFLHVDDKLVAEVDAGVLWVRVRRAPGAGHGVAQMFVSTDWAGPADQIPNVFKPAVQKTAWLDPFESGKAQKIDTRWIPAQGMMVPVYLRYDEAEYRALVQGAFAASGSKECQHAFEQSCVGGLAWSLWRKMLTTRVGEIDVFVSRSFGAPGQQVCKSDTVNGAFVQVCVPLPTTVGKTVDTLKGNLGRVFDGETHGRPGPYKACPGLRLWAPTDDETGLPMFKVVPDFDMNDL